MQIAKIRFERAFVTFMSKVFRVQKKYEQEKLLQNGLQCKLCIRVRNIAWTRNLLEIMLKSKMSSLIKKHFLSHS